MTDQEWDLRVRRVNDRKIDLKPGAGRPKPKYILYWMLMYKRLNYNHAFTYAEKLGKEYNLPVLVFEGLKTDYPWASRRMHEFIIEGAEHTASVAKERGIPYLFYLERKPSGKRNSSVLKDLCEHAAAVVTDDYPCFVVPGHIAAVNEWLECPLIAVDSNGVVPLNVMTKEEFAARTIRPKIHRVLPDYFQPYREFRWDAPRLKLDFLEDVSNAKDILSFDKKSDWRASLDKLPIDQDVEAVSGFKGGRGAGLKLLKSFLNTKLSGYAKDRNNPNLDATSNLSPYLHFGYVSPLEAALSASEAHDTRTMGTQVYLEELIVRRELSFNFTKFNPQHETFEGLPNWARESLKKHLKDKRDFNYSLKDFENAKTHDELWNAAQRELVLTGKMHGYVRMYWGKMFLAWSKDPAEALKWCVHLNNKYALDGRDPNSYAGIHWCFGKHDRPWGPERPVFGVVRYMTLSGMRRKFDVDGYIARF